jgi:hypothetical protein
MRYDNNGSGLEQRFAILQSDDLHPSHERIISVK